MRQIYLILMAFALMVSFSSCDKTTDISTLLGKMTAKIDGVEWSVSATDVSNGIGGVVAITAEEKFMITATATSGKTIIIVINGTDANTTYDLTPLAGEAGAATVYRENVDDADADTYFSTIGSVTITEKTDNRISGTFYFTAAKNTTDFVEITDGVFENVIYTSAENLSTLK